MIHLLCAFLPEARLFIQEFGLSVIKQEQTQFPIYQNQDKSISLTLSGPGKQAAAAAVMQTFNTLNGRKSDVWLNFGIAGHRDEAIGQLFLANKIVDQETAKSWYPGIHCGFSLQSRTCTTVNEPGEYLADTLLDMEASGFYERCSQIGISDLCHCLKLVSDNQQQPFSEFDRKQIDVLIKPHIASIREIMQQLSALAEQHFFEFNQGAAEPFLEKWHFTESQRLALNKLLNRWQQLKTDDAFSEMSTMSNAKAVLQALNQKLDAMTLNYD